MKRKTFLIILTSAISTIIVFASLIVAFAYFSTRIVLYTDDGQTEVFRSGMELNTFFDIINSSSSTGTAIDDSKGVSLGIKCTDTTIATAWTLGTTMGTGNYYKEDGGVNYFVYNKNAEWGSASNPYIISRISHLQNLYVLQNCGYFTSLTGNNKDANKVQEDDMPYFLVCTSHGAPVTINGTGKIFEYIGNDEYPFIGYVGGAFVDGTTTGIAKSEEDSGVTIKESDQSVIYNVTVQTNNDIIDVGLFGRIGYLGDITQITKVNGFDTFVGSVATVRDFLLYNVKVKVDDTSAWKKVIIDIGNHLFNHGTGTPTASARKEGCENHHIGILAGHVELATVEYISVYYDSDSIAAIDVRRTSASFFGTSDPGTATTPNYYSVCGILGFVDDMNSKQSNGVVTIDGINNIDIEVRENGAGTGGGIESGTGRGYVTAAEVLETYDDAGRIVKVKDKHQNVLKYGILIEYNSTSISYTNPDGYTSTTQLSVGKNVPARIDDINYVTTYSNYKNFWNQTEVVTETWYNYVVHDNVTTDKSEEYFYFNGSTKVTFSADNIETFGISMKYAAKIDNLVNYYELCTQYYRERIIAGTQATNRYYFYDGVFTFALSEAYDTISETWPDGVGSIVLGQDNNSSWTQDESALPNSVIAFMKPVTNATQLVNANGVFITYKDASGKYHLVTLDGNSTYTQGQGNNSVTTNQTQLELVNDTTSTAILNSAKNGTLTIENVLDKTKTLDDIENNWGSYRILDIGSTGSGLTLDQLKDRYKVTVSYKEQTASENYFEDDGATKATESLKSSALNKSTISGTYYPIGNITDVKTLAERNNYTYFALKNTSTIDISAVWNAINTQNNTLFEDNWSTALDSTLRSNIDISKTQQISQTEYMNYSGYYYFKTADVGGTEWRYYLYYVNTSGTETQVGYEYKDWNKDWEDELKKMFKSYSKTTGIDGQRLYMVTVNGYSNLPLLYYQSGGQQAGNYYRDFDRNTGYVDAIQGKTPVASINNHVFSISKTMSYNYILASETGSGLVYTWNGTSTSCSNVASKNKKFSDEAQYSTKTLYGKDYNLYTCDKGTGILITRYKIDGILLQSMTADGVTYSLINGSGTVLQSGLSSTFTDTGKTISVNGTSHKIYRNSSGKIGVRAANIVLDGYFQAEVRSSGTNYFLYYNDGSVSKKVQEPYLIPGVKVDENHTYLAQIPLSNGTTTKLYNLYLSEDSSNHQYLAIKLIYIVNDAQNLYKFWHDSNIAKDPYVLRLIYRGYVANIFSYYSMCVSTESYISNTNVFDYNGVRCNTLESTDYCTVLFNSDGSCYLQYTVRGTTRYLSYSTSGYFTTSSEQDDSSKLYIFSFEGTHDSSIGNHIIPIAGTQVGDAYSANEYVLWPENAYLSTDNKTSDYAPSNTYAKDTTYSIKSLSQLAGAGFNDNQGNSVTKSRSLDYVFSLGDGISDVNMYTLLNGNFGDKDSYVRAPVGTAGAESYIPTGCVAFRINTSSSKNKIRVIVAVPVSDYYYGQVGSSGVLNPASDTGLDYSTDYNFCMWKVPDISSGTSTSFSDSNCYASFELPRSTPYSPSTSTSDQTYHNISGNSMSVSADNQVMKYILVTIGTETYRAYLNGDQVLVAYEFTAEEEGLYLLGSTKECRIVFFSADSTANTGKDGLSSYRLGTIDFVYDNGIQSSTETTTATKILTVKDSDPKVDGTYDYSSYYYPTLCLLSTDNNNKDAAVITGDTDTNGGTVDGLTYKYANINDFAILIYRKRDGSAATIYWHAIGGTKYSGGIADAKYIKLSSYSLYADKITRGNDELRSIN